MHTIVAKPSIIRIQSTEWSYVMPLDMLYNTIYGMQNLRLQFYVWTENHNIIIERISFFQTTAIATFQASAHPRDTTMVQSLSCYGYSSDSNISRCAITFYTKSSHCDERYVAGLHCEGRLDNSILKICINTLHHNKFMLTELCTNGTIQLRGSSYATYGRVEICMSGNWGTVCNAFWDDRDASVICRQLGFAPHGMLITILSKTVTWFTETQHVMIMCSQVTQCAFLVPKVESCHADCHIHVKNFSSSMESK